MTDEEKIVVEEKQECHCECAKILTKFLLGTTSIFLGVLLAILVASALLRPKMPCPCKMGGHPGFERQLPPPAAAMHRHHGQRPDMQNFHNKDFKKFENYKKPEFNKEKFDKK